MLILTLRTDNPDAEIGMYEDTEKITYVVWTAHRQLAETIHGKVAALLDTQGRTWGDIQGIVCFEGPGSFTGLRIGLSVGNALANALEVPITGSTTDSWITRGIEALMSGSGQKSIVPHYGSEAHITLPCK